MRLTLCVATALLAVAPAQIEGLLSLVDGESVHPKCGGYGQIDPHCATRTPAAAVWRTGGYNPCSHVATAE
jgi:hypothetical protein